MHAEQSKEKRLPMRAQYVNVSLQKPKGKAPLMKLLDNIKLVNNVIVETDEGIEPVIPFPLKANLVRYIKFPMVTDKGPAKLLLVRFKPITERLASQVTPNHRFAQGSPIVQL